MKEKYGLVLIMLLTHFGFGLSQTSETPRPIPSNFPSDCIVTEHCPSCTSADSLIFYPDRTFVFKLGGIEGTQKHYELGIWKLDGGKVVIDIYKKLGIRPIGEPTNPEVRFASNPEDYFIYEEYVPYEEWVTETKTFNSESLDYFDISLDTCHRASQIKIDIQKYFINGDYKLASCRPLKNNDLVDLTKNELRLMRNEIFARYGYKFNSIDLQKHFLSKEWYNGYASNVDTYLTDVEKKNIKLIRAFEQK